MALSPPAAARLAITHPLYPATGCHEADLLRRKGNENKHLQESIDCRGRDGRAGAADRRCSTGLGGG